MATPQKSNEVVRAINALTAYRNILIKLAETEKDYANQHSLMFMMELNSRLIKLLNQYKENNSTLRILPKSLQVTPDKLSEYQVALYRSLVEQSPELQRLAKSQNVRWENFLSALAGIPGDMLEPFAISMLIGGIEVGGITLVNLLFDLTLTTPEWLAFDMAFSGYLAVVIVAIALAFSLATALYKAYENVKPTYEAERFTSLTYGELSALNELVDLTQESFEATFENVGSDDNKFEKISLTRSANDALQRFFKPQSPSDQSLADKAAASYDKVSSLMSI